MLMRCGIAIADFNQSPGRSSGRFREIQCADSGFSLQSRNGPGRMMALIESTALVWVLHLNSVSLIREAPLSPAQRLSLKLVRTLRQLRRSRLSGLSRDLAKSPQRQKGQAVAKKTAGKKKGVKKGPRAAKRAVRTTRAAAGNQLPRLNCIVQLMLENRSFDQMLGFLYQDSNNVSPLTGQPFEGLTGNETNPMPRNRLIKVFPIGTPNPDVPAAVGRPYFIPGRDPGEQFQDVNDQLRPGSGTREPANPIRASCRTLRFPSRHILPTRRCPTLSRRKSWECTRPTCCP